MPARFTGRREPVVRGAGSGAARKSHPAHTSRDGLSASASWAGSKPAYPSGSLRPQTGQTPVLSSSLRSAAGPRLPEQEGPERKEGTQPQCNVERWESISGIPDSVGGSVIVEGQALCDDPALFAPTLTTAPVREPAERDRGSSQRPAARPRHGRAGTAGTRRSSDRRRPQPGRPSGSSQVRSQVVRQRQQPPLDKREPTRKRLRIDDVEGRWVVRPSAQYE